MRKLFSFLVGIGMGASVGALVVLFFSPVSGERVKQRLAAGYQATMEAAREVAALRRAELEEELKLLQTRPKDRPQLESGQQSTST